MKVLTVIIIVTVAAALIIASARRLAQSSPTDQSKISVVGSFYPLAHWAAQVGGDRVEVTTITPAGAEPHDFEPTAQDIVKVDQAKLFISNGSGLDPWADKVQSDVIKNGGQVLKISDSIRSLDPHWWLDPVLAQQEVRLIQEALIKVDPAHAESYKANAERYINQLVVLDQAYRTGLAHCQLHDIVTAHAAFGYLAQEYSLNQIAIAGLSPDEEPSAQKLAEIATLAKQKGIKYIFFEQLVSPKLSETIAREVGARTLALNPLEGLSDNDLQAGQSYISVMTNNLANLRTALICQ